MRKTSSLEAGAVRKRIINKKLGVDMDKESYGFIDTKLEGPKQIDRLPRYHSGSDADFQIPIKIPRIL
jgi:hypothetical protein